MRPSRMSCRMCCRTALAFIPECGTHELVGVLRLMPMNVELDLEKDDGTCGAIVRYFIKSITPLQVRCASSSAGENGLVM